MEFRPQASRAPYPVPRRSATIADPTVGVKTLSGYWKEGRAGLDESLRTVLCNLHPIAIPYVAILE